MLTAGVSPSCIHEPPRVLSESSNTLSDALLKCSRLHSRATVFIQNSRLEVEYSAAGVARPAFESSTTRSFWIGAQRSSIYAPHWFASDGASFTVQSFAQVAKSDTSPQQLHSVLSDSVAMTTSTLGWLIQRRCAMCWPIRLMDSEHPSSDCAGRQDGIP